jgi:hypothetical protein
MAGLLGNRTTARTARGHQLKESVATEFLGAGFRE